MTRLRVKIKDVIKVASKAASMACGASGVFGKGESCQIIIGMDVQNIRNEFDRLM